MLKIGDVNFTNLSRWCVILVFRLIICQISLRINITKFLGHYSNPCLLKKKKLHYKFINVTNNQNNQKSLLLSYNRYKYNTQRIAVFWCCSVGSET